MTDDKTKEEKTDSSSPEAEKKSQNEAADAAEVVDDLAVLARDSEENGLRELMAVNYIEYASYVIKDRAIPDVYDGLKPVQRRILHSLRCLDDGRFHKVANVIGYTMQFHPHGDASIGSALVVLANKEYFIEKQGNFGNILTGDQASAARYIECRLTALALEVLFNSEITEFADSYDGRNREPVSLPAKIPSLLLLGADGIAVGMATHILPHNFNELLDAQIAILEERSFQVFPDFLSGGIMDVDEYADGAGKIKLRAKIDVVDDKVLVIREIPATTTTESLMNSIEDAARKGKIKIASINDYTGESVEIEIKLPRGIHAKEAVKALYAYTSCELGITSNLLVIHDNRPEVMTVTQILHLTTRKLCDDLKRELEIALLKLQERFHEKTLVQIFIENRIYKRIEECETYEQVIQEVRTGLEEFRSMLRRDITDEDIEKLLQIQIKRISRFDMNKNREELDNILRGMKETQNYLDHLTDFAISYIRKLLEKYGKLYPRRTRIADLEEIDVRKVALKNIRVGYDRVGHFVGTEVKNSNKTEELLVCTEYDRLVLLRNNGTFKVIPITDKMYVGPVKYVFKANKQQVYSMIYREKKSNKYYAKCFRFDKYIMDREYTTIPKGCIIENVYTNYGVVVRCNFKPNKRLKEAYVDVDFDAIPIRATAARGFKVAQFRIEGFVQQKRGTVNGPDDLPAEEAKQNDSGLIDDGGKHAAEPVEPEVVENSATEPDGECAAKMPEVIANDDSASGGAVERKKRLSKAKPVDAAVVACEPAAKEACASDKQPKSRKGRKADPGPMPKPAKASGNDAVQESVSSKVKKELAKPDKTDTAEKSAKVDAEHIVAKKQSKKIVVSVKKPENDAAKAACEGVDSLISNKPKAEKSVSDKPKAVKPQSHDTISEENSSQHPGRKLIDEETPFFLE